MSLDADTSGTMSRDLVICNTRGLHARAAAKFVRCAEQFDAGISVLRDGQSVPGTSIMGLLMLSATHGCTIRVSAEGAEAGAALDALEALVSGRFGED
jgi:phosphocarrier protein